MAVLWLVIPCYNEEDVLPMTSGLFLNELIQLINSGKIDNNSRILFVNDGSKDSTWDIIECLSRQNEHFIGISQSRNRGHQNAIFAGMMEAKEYADIVITVDCDGQDDVHAIADMVDAYLQGNDVVYGVRSSRETDTFMKRFTAQTFYKIMRTLGADTVYNHADYRLVSHRALDALSDYKEVNLFLRGLFPLIGFKSSIVYYTRNERMAGTSKYPLSKMIALAVDGITSMSNKILHLVFAMGAVFFGVGLVGVFLSIVFYCLGKWEAVPLILFCMLLLSGFQLLCLGIVGEYVGKTYLETKERPRYIISRRTWETDK